MKAPMHPDATESLRVVFDLLLQDMAMEPVDPATLPWDQPILLLRAAPLDHLKDFFARLPTYSPTPDLHILSHARDRDALREMAPCDFTFHAYPTPGRYCLEEVPAAMLARLRATGFGALLVLDTGDSATLFDEVERLLAAIDGQQMIAVQKNGLFLRSAEWRQRRRAQAAFLRLVAWSQPMASGDITMSENQDGWPAPRATNDRS
jgi:hypothetical protein